MVDYLLHFCKKGSPPFRTLSALPEAQAIPIMNRLYIPGSTMWERFSDPAGYMSFRTQVEASLREGFMAKGARLADAFPIYAVLGRPPWTVQEMDEASRRTTEEIPIPLSLFDSNDVSFTFPASMASAELAAEKDPGQYEPEFHGRVFALEEIEEIVKKKGMPGETWKSRLPQHRPHYIEAQVWNHSKLHAYYCRMKEASRLP